MEITVASVEDFDPHWSRKRMPAELARSAFHQDARRFDGQRRQRIGFRSRRIKRTCTCLARDAEFPLRFRVVGFEVVVSDGPILKIGTGNRPFSRPLYKVEFVESPVVGGEMNAAAANDAAIRENRLECRCLAFRFPKGGWLLPRIVRKCV